MRVAHAGIIPAGIIPMGGHRGIIPFLFLFFAIFFYFFCFYKDVFECLKAVELKRNTGVSSKDK